MTKTGPTSITRRSAVAGLALAAAPIMGLAAADKAVAQAGQTTPEKSLYSNGSAAPSPSRQWWITSATPS